MTMNHGTIRFDPSAGRDLRDELFERGVEFPCGGTTGCGGCRVRVLEGEIPITPEMRAVLSTEELQQGWRLGCMARCQGEVLLEIAQWSVEVLDDQRKLEADFLPRPGRYGAAVDLGTTTVVTQLVDLETGVILAVDAALNPQARFGADLMTRIRHDLANPGELASIIRDSLGNTLARLAAGRTLDEVLLVGNTAMHHFFCGHAVEPLAAVPFRSPALGEYRLEQKALGWDLNITSPVIFLPCIGGFVGSDLLAGLIATEMFRASDTCALLDLGTNGEIAVGSRSVIHCASTAAGPAFEGGRIGKGMRAGHGAIDQVWTENGCLRSHVIGGGEARGICGSGLVDATASALELGWLEPSGRIAPNHRGIRQITLAPDVVLTQADIRELQLAKGAVAAGLELLLEGRAIPSQRVHLAGAFGNYVRPRSARAIGLLPSWVEAPQAAGNSALRGARQLLLAGAHRDALIQSTLSRTHHLELATHPKFQDAFVDQMRFPD